MVRCKFVCQSVRKFKDYSQGILFDYTFSVVTNGSEENKQFFKYTPSGSLSVSSVSADHFEVGKEYYIDISEA